MLALPDTVVLGVSCGLRARRSSAGSSSGGGAVDFAVKGAPRVRSARLGVRAAKSGVDAELLLTDFNIGFCSS